MFPYLVIQVRGGTTTSSLMSRLVLSKRRSKIFCIDCVRIFCRCVPFDDDGIEVVALSVAAVPEIGARAATYKNFNLELFCSIFFL